jgi:hypothetical protein
MHLKFVRRVGFLGKQGVDVLWLQGFGLSFGPPAQLCRLLL